MSLSSFFSTYKYTLRKIFGVALMVYLALMVKIEGIGETDEVVQFDYFVDTHGAAVPEFCQMYQNEKKQQSPLHLLLEELCQDYKPEGESGFSAPETSFTRLCEKSSVLCEKTTFNGNFSTEEKADYFGQVKRLVEDIDSTAKRGTALEQVFTQILINQLKGERRGSSTWTKLTMNIGGLKYPDEFFQVLTHEAGHIVDLGSLQGKSSSKSNVFTEFGKKVFAIDDPSLEYYRYSRQSETIRKSGVNKSDFCSGYGMTDPFEDFAECHNLYLNHNNLFQSLARNNPSLKEKYNFFANLYGGHYLSHSFLALSELDLNWRAWDTTRMQEV